MFLTNGNGEAWNAQPIYAALIQHFDIKQAMIAVLSFNDENIASRLQFELCQKKYRELLTMMKTRVSAPAIRELIDRIEGFTGPFDKLRDDGRIKAAVLNMRRILEQQEAK